MVSIVYMTITSKTVPVFSLFFIIILAFLFIYCRYIFIIVVLMNDMTDATVFGGEIYISLYFVKFSPHHLNISYISYNLNVLCISCHMSVVFLVHLRFIY